MSLPHPSCPHPLLNLVNISGELLTAQVSEIVIDIIPDLSQTNVALLCT